MLDNILENLALDKKGLEIGGPSHHNGSVIYKNADLIDNCIFSKNTVWSIHSDEYNYHPGKKGKVIVNDFVDMHSVKNEEYDFCFSSHCLEHIANPLKAVAEWLRILKKGGYCVIVVPEKSMCFDHKRQVSSFDTLLKQYINNVSEHDLSTLPEILANHDLPMDPAAGNFEQFTKRSLDNFNNRCLHHYVYSPALLQEICSYFRCESVYTETIGIDIWYIMRKP